MHRIYSLSLLGLIGCAELQTSQPNTAPDLTFTQRFEASRLCFDDDGAEQGWATGCATDPWIDIAVIDGAVQSGSNIGLTGGNTFMVNGLPYNATVSRVEPVVGNFTWDDDTQRCFSGTLEQERQSADVKLKLTGGVQQSMLQMVVEISGDAEAHAELQVIEPIDPTFAGSSSVTCPVVEDTAGVEELPGDTAEE